MTHNIINRTWISTPSSASWAADLGTVQRERQRSFRLKFMAATMTLLGQSGFTSLAQAQSAQGSAQTYGMSMSLGQVPVVNENWSQPATHAALIPESTVCGKDAGLVQNSLSMSSQQVRSMNLFLQANLHQIKVQSDRNDIPADGQTPVRMSAMLLDAQGQPLKGEMVVTVNTTDGRLQMPCRLTPETGPGAADLSKADRATQVLVKDGYLNFTLLAPSKAGAVTVQVLAGGKTVNHTVVFVAELREAIAVGLLEAKLRLDSKSRLQIDPIRENDAFEKELRNVSRDFNDGKGALGVRGAMFLKGKIKGDALLTVAYDSEKEARGKLFKDINPNDYYPVYGDSSLRGNDAQSADRLYVRIDKGRSFVLYGDYNTNQNIQTFGFARELGQYSRTLTGARGHFEDVNATVDAFIAHESTRQVVDEYAGRGVSGPYTLSTPNAIANSEKIDILTRDRLNPSIVLKTEPQIRFVDYDLDPFLGRIIFKRPIASADPDFNPQSIRITYEIEEGTQKHTIAGVSGAIRLASSVVLSAGAFKDANPVTPIRGSSVGVGIQLGANTTLSAEVAKSDVLASLIPVASGGVTGSAPASGAGLDATSLTQEGKAARLELKHSSPTLSARMLLSRSSNTFYNPSSSVGTGKAEVAVNTKLLLSPELAVKLDAQKSEDTLGGGERKQAQLGAEYKFSPILLGEIGVRKLEESGARLLLGSGNGAAGYGSGYGTNSTTGTPSSTGTGGTTTNTGPLGIAPPGLVGNNIDYTGVRARLTYKPSDKTSVFGEFEKDTHRTRSLTTLGGDVRLTDDGTKLYGRLERGNGWYNNGTELTSGTFGRVGLESPLLGGTAYNEYRMRSAINGVDAETAYGLRNTFKVNESWRLGSNLEFIRANSGLASDATAVGLGAEYVGDALNKFGGRVEYRTDRDANNWLSTLAYARKLDRDWTLLLKNYYTDRNPKTATATASMQDRAQAGLAFRPVDNNTWNMLGRYEYKIERNGDPSVTETAVNRRVHIFGTHWDYHPSRPWWLNARYAYKSVNEMLPGNANAAYRAQLLSGRLTYDVSDKWSVGSMLAYMEGRDPGYLGSKQWAIGLETGYLVAENVWLNVGYNWRGFNDRDASLGLGNYTNSGWNVGLKYKFDETLFGANNSSVNKVLAPNSSSGAAPLATVPAK